MTTRFSGFIGPSYTHSSVNVDCQRAANLYPEINPPGTGKAGEVASLVSTPGLLPLLTLPTLPLRGFWYTSTGVLYAVGGNKLYSITSSWVATERGTLVTSTGAVSMADNGIQLVIVDGTNGYYLTLATSAFAQITDPNFLGSKQVAFIDGYFIFVRPDTQQFYCSDLYAITFTALNTARAEGSPDNLVGHIAVKQVLYLFGAQSTEGFYDSGNTPCPFTRIQGAVVGVGCAATHSIAEADEKPYWIGGDKTGIGIVYRMDGYKAERISTPAVEAAIRGAGTSNVANARAWVYQQGGHVFYCLNVPTLNSTWVYDVSTGFWHERTYLGRWGQERHRAECAAVAYNKNVVGDYETGAIYSLDSETYSDNSVAISRVRAAVHIYEGGRLISHHAFHLDMETGVGLSGTGQGTDPKAVLQWSDDGGHNWTSERYADIGKIGQFKTRVTWRRLGASRDRVYRVTISEPVKVVLIGAELELEAGAA